MSKYSLNPKDYELAGFLYDARVVSASSWYLNLQHEASLVLGELGEETDRQIEADLAAYAETLDSRADGIHRPVRLRTVHRLVCTCSLVVHTEARFREPAGHLDARWRLARTVVIDLADGGDIRAACQECGTSTRHPDVGEAQQWATKHQCPLRPTTPPAPTGTYRRVETDLGEAPADVVHRNRAPLPDDAALTGGLVPWEVNPRHLSQFYLEMLRCEEKRRQGVRLGAHEARRLTEWIAYLGDLNAVVAYDPGNPDGFALVPRSEGDDDLIHRPVRSNLPSDGRGATALRRLRRARRASSVPWSG